MTPRGPLLAALILATLVGEAWSAKGRGAPPPGRGSPGGTSHIDMGGAQFSLINALATGNLIFDMLLAMIVPVLFKFLFSDMGGWLKKLREWLFPTNTKARDECIRTISYLSLGSSLAGREHKNQVLQKAITLYLTETTQATPFRRKAQVALTAVHDTSVGSGPVDKFNPLAKYRLTWQAPENEWVEIQQGLWFQQRTTRDGAEKDDDDDSGGGGGAMTREVVTFELKCAAKEGPAEIDDFLAAALAWYKEQLLRLRDDARYMYSMVSAGPTTTFAEAPKPGRPGAGGSSGGGDGFRYKRYKLADNKTFESLFFPEKEGLLKLLEDFAAKRGKYAVKGYPHKLGLLLHGPPGTGKTSLIKALAHHTNRSIINTPLSRVKTNQDLMDLMFDLKMNVAGQDMATQLSYKEVHALWRYSRDTAQMQPRCSRDAAEMQPRCSRDAAEMQPRCSRDAAEIQP